MKRRILIIAVCTLMIGYKCARAQSQVTTDQMRGTREKFEDLKTKLNLTDDQSKKVKAIDSAYFQGIAGLKGSDGSRLTKFRKYKSLSSKRDQQMKTVLNKEQYEEFQQFKSEMKTEIKANRKKQ